MVKRKTIAAYVYVCAAAVCLAGCGSGAGNDTGAENAVSAGGSAAVTSATESKADSGKGSTQENKSSTAPDESFSAAAPLEVPMINIVTKDQSAGVMKFVTEPVAAQVSESIASWNRGYVIPPEPYYEECTVTVTDESGTQLLSADAQVKVRGNWTTNYDKKPLRIKFDKKQSMLGMNDGGEYKNWLLLGEYKDFSMLRNKTALNIAQGILGADGYYAADTRFAEVTINGEYWGMYLLTEQQQAAEGRADVTRPEKDYTGTDIGYFMEYDGYYTTENPLNSFRVNYDKFGKLTAQNGREVTCLSGGANDVGISIKSDINSQEQHDFIANYVRNVYEIMYRAAYEDAAYVFDDDYSEISITTDITPREAVERVVDVQSLADSYIVCEIACDADIYWSSFFMDADFGEGGDGRLRFEAPWDFDSALGNKDRCASGEGYYAVNPVFDVNDNYVTINPWLAVLWNEDWYVDLVKERWTAAYDAGVFSGAVDMIHSDTENFAAAFERNYDRWDNIRNNGAVNELCAASRRCSTQEEAADYLAEWLTKRVEFLNKEWHL